MNFEQQFTMLKPFVQQYSQRISRATNIPTEEFESAMFEELYLKYNRYDGRIPFHAFIKPILQQRARRTAELKSYEFYRKTILLEDLEDSKDMLFEFADSTDVLEEVIERECIEKSPDKLLLIRALTKDTDEFTVAAVNLIYKKPNASWKSLSTEMGVHHSKIPRKLAQLAKNYDPSRFGEDIAQYLAI